MEIDTEIFENFMKTVTDRLTRQEQMIQILVDDLKERNKDGKLYIRGERMYDSIELRKLLMMGKRTLQRYSSSGQLPYMKLLRTCYYRESDVVKLLEEKGKYFDKKAKDRFLVSTNKTRNGDNIATVNSYCRKNYVNIDGIVDKIVKLSQPYFMKEKYSPQILICI